MHKVFRLGCSGNGVVDHTSRLASWKLMQWDSDPRVALSGTARMNLTARGKTDVFCAFDHDFDDNTLFSIVFAAWQKCLDSLRLLNRGISIKIEAIHIISSQLLLSASRAFRLYYANS